MRNKKPLPELHCDRHIQVMHCERVLIEAVTAPHLIPRDTLRTVGPALPLVLSFRISQACVHRCASRTVGLPAARSLLDAKPGQCLHIGHRRSLATLSARDARSRRPAPPQSTLRRRVAQCRPTLLPAFPPPHRTEPEPEPSPEPGASTAFCISPWHDVMGPPVGWWNSEMPPAGGGCPLGRKVQVGTGTWLLREGGDHAHVPRPTSHVRCRIECSNQGSGSLVPASPNRAMATSPKIQSSTSTRSFL